MLGATLVRYRLHQDGEDLGLLTLPEFLADNAELDPATVDAIRLLAPGETYTDGGGAQPVWSITRAPAEPPRCPHGVPEGRRCFSCR